MGDREGAASAAGSGAAARPAAGRPDPGTELGARPAQDGTLWFLDFDGVLCDSLPECYAVSRTAYWKIGRAHV